MAIRIEDDFKHLIPPLTKEEFNQLEQNILDYGIRDPLVVAVYPESKGEVLIDGHNRYQISIKHGNLAYSVRRLDFDSKESAMCWVIDNQLGRRNIDSVTKFKLGSKKAELLKDKAKENQKQYYGNQYERTSINVDKSAEPVNIQKEIAKASGLSTGTVAKLQKIEKESPDKLDKIRAGEISINQAYQTVKRNNKIDEVKKRIEEYSSVQTGIVDIYKEHKKYNIIYADPPWKYWESGQKNQEIHYTTMTIDDICKLQKLFGIRCLFLVFDKEDNNIYFQFLDVLEAGVKATTANGKIIIYPLENFRVSDRNVGEFIREQDPFEKAMDIICELEKDQETMERLKENL